jgi:cobalt-zinc-cadmium efflux system protein
VSGGGLTVRDRRRGRRALFIVVLLTAAFMVVEFVGGLLTGSLALLADAGHMLADVAALGLSLFALWFSTRPATPKKSYGFHRTEILAALANGVAIVVIAIMILTEAIRRIGAPPAIDSVPMLVVAVTGLGINLVAVWLLHRESSHSLNLRGAFLHVLGDTLGSVGAIAAAIVMMTTGAWLADPLVSFFVALLIVISAAKLIRQSVDVLLEGVPPHLDVEEIRRALLGMEGVTGVHDLHVWTITSGFDSLTAHLAIEDGADHQQVLRASNEMLAERFGLPHTTLQPECAAEGPCAHHTGFPCD